MIWNIAVFWLNFQKVRHYCSGTKNMIYDSSAIQWDYLSNWTSIYEPDNIIVGGSNNLNDGFGKSAGSPNRNSGLAKLYPGP